MATRAYQYTGNAYQGAGQFAYQGFIDDVGGGYPGYPFQGPKVTYTGPPSMVTASKNSPYLVGNPYRKTHNNGPHWPS